MKELLKAFLLLLYGIATIMTCSGLWSSKPEITPLVVSIALFFANAYIIYEKAKNIKDKDKE